MLLKILLFDISSIPPLKSTPISRFIMTCTHSAAFMVSPFAGVPGITPFKLVLFSVKGSEHRNIPHHPEIVLTEARKR